MNERKIIEQIAWLLGISQVSDTEKMLRAIRDETFKNLRKGMGADWGDPQAFIEDNPWVAEMLSEDKEAKQLFGEWDKTHKERSSRN